MLSDLWIDISVEWGSLPRALRRVLKAAMVLGVVAAIGAVYLLFLHPDTSAQQRANRGYDRTAQVELEMVYRRAAIYGTRHSGNYGPKDALLATLRLVPRVGVESASSPAAAKPGTVSVISAGPGSLVLVTKSTSGTVYRLTAQSGGRFAVAAL